ncbi:MAG: MBL fold metallo-hydrolase [Fibromonadaceae bacterium]|jgi:glyoxylase-like metal-dependent hydrolase (beta-lactamase superfamily II)|nr:MBL fold metallo-hydrolase [Fibromonadaceae bacterium]
MNKLTISFALFFAAGLFAQALQTPKPPVTIKLEGEIEVTSIDDQPREMDASLFSGKLTEEQKLAYMPGGKAPASVNVFLVKTGGKTYMIDAGFGNAVKDKRIEPQKIDGIFITHEHGDHISGLLEGDSAVFSAPVFIAKLESEYWLKPETPNSDLQKKLASVYANRYKIFAFGDTLAPGVVAINAVGHTPGHTAFLIGTGKQKLLIAGDFLHAAALQFPEPTESANFDVNKNSAAKTRKFLIELAEKNGWLIAGVHIPNPGWGNVKSNGKGGFIFSTAN